MDLNMLHTRWRGAFWVFPCTAKKKNKLSGLPQNCLGLGSPNFFVSFIIILLAPTPHTCLLLLCLHDCSLIVVVCIVYHVCVYNVIK